MVLRPPPPPGMIGLRGSEKIKNKYKKLSLTNGRLKMRQFEKLKNKAQTFNLLHMEQYYKVSNKLGLRCANKPQVQLV